MNPGHYLDYKQLCTINPEAARQAVLGYLVSVGRNVSKTAVVFGINRCVVYDTLKRQAIGDLSDRPSNPKHQPNKTSPEIEERVIEAKNKTHLVPSRLSLYLAKYEQVQIPPGTIHHIVHRKRDSIEAHLTIVFATLAISRKIEHLTGISIKQILKILCPIRSGVTTINGKEILAEPELPETVKTLLIRLSSGH